MDAINDKSNTIDIARMICGVAENLRTQYEMLSQIPHYGERGHLLEEALSRVIEPYLPRHFGIGTGHIIGSEPCGDEAQSLQTDIIVYDALDMVPLFVGSGGYKILWHEAVRSVIEVKSKLNSNKIGAVPNSLIPSKEERDPSGDDQTIRQTV